MSELFPTTGRPFIWWRKWKLFFSFPWHLETVRQTLATKLGDGATTSDQWQLALSRPVARQTPPGVKRAYKGQIESLKRSYRGQCPTCLRFWCGKHPEIVIWWYSYFLRSCCIHKAVWPTTSWKFKRLYKSYTKVSVEIVQNVDVKKISVKLQHNTGNVWWMDGQMDAQMLSYP